MIKSLTRRDARHLAMAATLIARGECRGLAEALAQAGAPQWRIPGIVARRGKLSPRDLLRLHRGFERAAGRRRRGQGDELSYKGATPLQP